VRVATYTQPLPATRGSHIALVLLLLTVVMGSSALHTLMLNFAPQLHSALTLLWLATYVAAFLGLMFSHGINWISWLARYRILLVIVLIGCIMSVAWSLDAAVSAERVVHLRNCYGHHHVSEYCSSVRYSRNGLARVRRKNSLARYSQFKECAGLLGCYFCSAFCCVKHIVKHLVYEIGVFAYGSRVGVRACYE